MELVKQKKPRTMILSEGQVKRLLNSITELKNKKNDNNNSIHHPNNDGKFEFQFDKEIGQNFSTNSEYAYQFAVNSFKIFKDTFGIKDEPCVMEADLNTWIAMLAGILEEFETFNDRNNILKIKPQRQTKTSSDQDPWSDLKFIIDDFQPVVKCANNFSTGIKLQMIQKTI